MIIKFKRAETSYGALRRECLEAIRQWPGCDTVAGIQLLRDNTPAGFSIKITLYGKADKKIDDRAMIFVQREKRRHYSY
jgi:hypothetical protein